MNWLDTNADGLALLLIFGTAGLAIIAIAFLVQYVIRTSWRLDDWDRVADRKRRLERSARNVRAGIR